MQQLRQLLDRGAVSDLHDAATLGSAVHAAELLARGEEPDSLSNFGWRPLHLAAIYGHARVAAILLTAGADANGRSASIGMGTTPLLCAVAGSHFPVVELLLAHGASVNAADDAGYTALHLAAELGTIAIVKRLLQCGSAPDPIAGDATPLEVALRERNLHIAALLHQVGG